MVAVQDVAENQGTLTADDFDALARAALDIADGKLKEAAEYAAAAAYLSVAGKVSSLPEPKPMFESFLEPLMKGGPLSSGFMRGFKPTPAQIRVAQQMTKNLYKMNDGDMPRVANSIYQHSLTTGANRIVSYPDVLQVLQTMSSMQKLQPKGVNPGDSIGRIRGYADDILRVAGVCSAAGGAYYTLRSFDTSITPPQLPPDWYFN